MSVSRHVEVASSLKVVLVIDDIDDAGHSFEGIVRSVCESLAVASGEHGACRSAHELRLEVNGSLWLGASEVVHTLDEGGGADACGPRVNGSFAGEDELYRAVNTGSWVPSGAFLHVFEVHFHGVLTHFHEVSDVHSESVVAVSPVTGFLSVDIDCRLSHRTVKFQYGSALVRTEIFRLDVDGGAVMSLSYPRQGTGPSSLFGSLLLSILLDGHHLYVPFLVKRTADSPVVRHADGLPCLLVFRKIPCLQVHFLAVLCHSCSGDGE